MGQGHSKDKVDKATGMTEREKQLVLSSWHAYTTAHSDYGVHLFDALFTAHPDYLTLFNKFKGKDLDALREDTKFREHGVTIGMQLNNIVESVEHPDNLLMLVRNNAEFHTRITGVTPKHFEDFGHVIVDVLKSKEEKLMTPPAVEAWGKLFTLVNGHIVTAFEAGPKTSDRLASRSTLGKQSVRAKPSGSVAQRAGGHLAAPSRSKAQREQSPKSPVSPSKPHLKKEPSTKVLKKEETAKALKKAESSKSPLNKKEQSKSP
ncbi:myoglobin-like [Dermacentor silvarum]|uniref:myoglobin-like n=1 Tax=Dermacentor silvarum TaxID=543639 RepID=UPI00189B4177|nr:myoglobin-like [Dermacentor silvarum]